MSIIDMTSSSLYTIVAALVTIGLVAVVHISSKHDPREPPPVSGGIPIIGHVIGLIRHSFNYHLILSRKCGLPIFTLKLPGSKLYVVTSPELIQAVQKQQKRFSITLIRLKLTLGICGVSDSARQLIERNADGAEGKWGVMEESFVSMHATLSPSRSLDEVNQPMLKHIERQMDTQDPEVGKSKTFNLWEWTEHTITEASALAIYGPQHPFRDADVVKSFWEFERGLTLVLLAPLPSLTAKKAFMAREKLVHAFEKYHKNQGHSSASSFAREYYEIKRNLGMSLTDASRLDVIGAAAIMVNTVPASFWMVLLICSQPKLLEEIRQELDASLSSTTDNDGRDVKTLDITVVKDTCPLLVSTLQEVLRYRTVGTTIREVTEDTMLQDQWLLKKGAVIQIPALAVHQNTDNWGTDAAEFRPRRFMSGEKHLTANGKKPSDTGYRAFGGGKSLCPGRHFANNEILAFATAFILRYDIESAKGTWEIPSTKNTSAASVVMTPDHDVPVTIKRRKGFEDCAWRILLKPSGKTLAFVVDTSSTDM